MLDAKYQQTISAYGFYRKDLESKNIKGADYDEVVRLDDRIKQIAAEVESDDINGFNQKLVAEGITTKLNEAYMRAVSAYTKQPTGKIGGAIPNPKNMASSVFSSKSSGNIVNDVKRMKEDPSKENAIQLAKETGRQSIRLARFIQRIKRLF